MYAYALIVVIAGIIIYIIRPPPLSPACNMNNPRNRIFEAYYGIEKNLFSELSAEKGDNPFLEGVVPENLFDKNSFILQAKRGGGKTVLRKRYLANKEVKLKFYNKQANYIFRNFVKNMKNKYNNSNSNINNNNSIMRDSDFITNYWTGEHFEHTIIYLFSQSIIKNYYKSKEKYESLFKKIISEDEKLKLSAIICLYARHDQIKTVNEIINYIWLGENYLFKEFKIYSIDETDPRTNRKVLKKLYVEILDLQDKIQIIERFPDNLHTIPLQSFFNIMENFQYNMIHFSKTNRLTYVLEFYKEHFKTTPCLIIDSLDEVSFFFDEKIIRIQAMKAFIKSALNNNILAKCYDSSINLVYMFPKLPNLDIKDFIERRDKIPLLTLEWKPSQLRNYADFMLENMRTTEINKCKILPDFYTLVNYRENKDLISSISTPRGINIFMQDLILNLNADAYENQFVPTTKNIRDAIDSSSVRMNNIVHNFDTQ